MSDAPSGLLSWLALEPAKRRARQAGVQRRAVTVASMITAALDAARDPDLEEK